MLIVIAVLSVTSQSQVYMEPDSDLVEIVDVQWGPVGSNIPGFPTLAHGHSAEEPFHRRAGKRGAAAGRNALQPPDTCANQEQPNRGAFRNVLP